MAKGDPSVDGLPGRVIRANKTKGKTPIKQIIAWSNSIVPSRKPTGIGLDGSIKELVIAVANT